MPIMTATSRLTGQTWWRYVAPESVSQVNEMWTVCMPEPVPPDVREQYILTRSYPPASLANEALADWERELLEATPRAPLTLEDLEADQERNREATPTPVTVEPEAETGDDEPDDEDDDNTFECEWCAQTTHVEQQHGVGTRDSVDVCTDCWQEARECDHCGRPIDLQGDAYTSFGDWDPTYLCSRCEHYAHWCDSCDEHYDGRYYDTCPRGCYDSDGGGLHNYSHKPMPEFHIVDRDGKPTIVRANALHTTRRELVSVPFMGFELEMERNGSGTRIDDIVDLVREMWGDFAYCKHDGSLNDGLELVTHPFTLEYAHEHINWDLLDSIRREGYRSWNTTTAGMHVHVNRATFTGPAHLFRFAQLIYKNEPTCSSFAGRSNNAYATFHDGYQKGYLANVVKGRAHGSRGAVNMQNTDTVEVRIFKGSLRYQRVLANLEFVHACVEYTRQLTVPDVVRGGLAWRTFATWILDNRSTYPHLFEYLDLNPTNPNHTNEPALATY